MLAWHERWRSRKPVTNSHRCVFRKKQAGAPRGHVVAVTTVCCLCTT